MYQLPPSGQELKGTQYQSIVHPRETFKAAILANATAVILAYNHPSGDTEPAVKIEK